jgi:hypothetical protein
MNAVSETPEPGPVDDRPLADVLAGIVGYPMVLVAHALGLWRALEAGPRPVDEICAALGIERRPAEAMLAVCASTGLLVRTADGFALSPTAEALLLEDRPAYFGGYLEVAGIANNALYAFENVMRSVMTNAPTVYGTGDLYGGHEQQGQLARSFTRAMHGHSMGPALAWPGGVDLSEHRVMLDVGGGSGAHAIGAALAWPELRAIVLELPAVVEVAHEYVARAGLHARIRPVTGDMWTDPYPDADLHFYSEIFHNWPPDKCRRLARKSFEALPPGGRIAVHELLYDDDKAGPFPVAAFAVGMLLWTEGQQYSGRELREILSEAGFVDVEVRPTSGYWSLVTARKPC